MAALESASTRLHVRLAQVNYEIFSQPVEIKPLTSDEPWRWVLCGLVASHRFKTESLVIYYIGPVFFSLLLLFLLTGIPFLNLAVAGRQGWLSRWGVRWLALAGVCGSAIAALICLYTLAMAHVESVSLTRLKELAYTIQANFAREVSQLRSLLLCLENETHGDKSTDSGPSERFSLLATGRSVGPVCAADSSGSMVEDMAGDLDLGQPA